MKFKNFVNELDKTKINLQDWVQDSKQKDVFYFWESDEKGYKYYSNNIENIFNKSDYSFLPFEDDLLKEDLDHALSKKLNEDSLIGDYSNLFGKWLMDEEDNSKYYYWKGDNKGYLVEMQYDGIRLPRITNVELIDNNYLKPHLMKEFKDYKIKRALNQKMREIKDENLKSINDIFEHWTQDSIKDDTYYYWKNENEGYIALVENNPLPQIVKFEAVDNEYFEPRSLDQVKNNKVKKVLDKKLK